MKRVPPAKSGTVSAFSIDPTSGKLSLLNQQPSEGSGPCHLVVDRTGKGVLVANYGSGSIAALPIQEDGRLGPASAAIQHKGSSIDPQRQEGPHAHCILTDPANPFCARVRPRTGQGAGSIASMPRKDHSSPTTRPQPRSSPARVRVIWPFIPTGASSM